MFALFLIMVFGFRFCIEYIKERQNSPVEDIMIEAIGLKMGQLLSAPFLIFGFIALYLSTKQKKPEPFQEPPPKPNNFTKHKPKPHPQPNNNSNVNRHQKSSNKPTKKKKN